MAFLDRSPSGFGVDFTSGSTVRLDLELFKFVERFACGVGVGVGAPLSCACMPARAITIPSPETTPGSLFTTSPLGFDCTPARVGTFLLPSLHDGDVD